MLDLRIRGGLLVDGSGTPGRPADVGVRDGRVVALDADAAAEPARSTVDADGLVVAPGFVDIHTHQDAQLFWDPACTPSPLYGCTTVVAGNCGFSIAPLAASEAEYVMRMLARVEGIPLATLEAGVPWSWTSFGDYLAAVEAVEPAVNAGFMVGHSAIRRAVMGAGAHGPASPDEIAAMRALLAESLASGGFGFSSSWAATHCDGDGAPVPSRAATSDELVALCEVVAGAPGTQVEFIPTNDAFGDEHVTTMARMSLAAHRPVNWNVLIPRGNEPAVTAGKLAASDAAAAMGARVMALSYPDVIRSRATFQGALFDRLPAWAPVMTLPLADKLRALADPDVRARLYAGSRSDGAGNFRDTAANWDAHVLAETSSERYQRFVGQSFAAIGAALGRSSFDALLDVVVADRLRTAFLPPAPADDEASWAIRERTWTDPRVVLGASDAGAHLDLIWTYDWACAFLARVRERRAMPIETAVRRLGRDQADLYGLPDRGRVEVGAAADLVLFDPDAVGPGTPVWRDDLPGGAGRLTGEPTGIAAVYVNGTAVVRDNALTGARPGRVLRSGRDTVTVAV
jgi:N-acyl-D-aspartate/D-glutamate deacylase